jgi:integrase
MDRRCGGRIVQRGSLKPIKNRRGVNVWRAQWREGGRGKTRILGRVLDINRADARLMLDRILAPLNATESHRKSSGVTVREFTENEYLTTKSRVWKTSTRMTTEQIIRDHILEAIGERLLPDVPRQDLQALVDRKAADGSSKSLVDHIRWQLVALFRMAKADGIILIDPAEGLVPSRVDRQIDKRTTTKEAIVRAQMVLDIRERLIFRLEVCEGVRPGEIVGLQVGDIANDVVHVQRRVYRGVVDTPKSKQSRREIPLTAITAALWVQYRDLLRNAAANAWVFPSENGSTPISYSNVYRRRIQPRLKLVGLGDLNAQVLRRTWVTEFSKDESDPRVRAAIGGHSVDVHTNEYYQPDLKTKRQAMDRLGKRLQ